MLFLLCLYVTVNLRFHAVQDSSHPDDLFQSRYVNPGFKLFCHFLEYNSYFLYLQPKHWNYPFMITFNLSLPPVSNIIIKHFSLELRGKLYRYGKPQSSVWQHTSLLDLFVSCDTLKQLFAIHLLWPSHAPPTLATFWLSSTVWYSYYSNGWTFLQLLFLVCCCSICGNICDTCPYVSNGRTHFTLNCKLEQTGSQVWEDRKLTQAQLSMEIVYKKYSNSTSGIDITNRGQDTIKRLQSIPTWSCIKDWIAEDRSFSSTSLRAYT